MPHEMPRVTFHLATVNKMPPLQLVYFLPIVLFWQLLQHKCKNMFNRIALNTCQEEMCEMRITILNWKTFICMQNPTCWPDIFT